MLTGLAQFNLEQGAASMRAARLAGVPIALGSDVRLATGLEIQRMVHHGLTPAEALVAATRTAAEALGLGEHIGTVAEGKLADLIVVDGDPLTEPRLLSDPGRIWLVLQLGVPVAGQALSPPSAPLCAARSRGENTPGPRSPDVAVRVVLHRYGFALAYLACVVAVELAYTLLDPDAQARLIAWASTNVANLEHEPVGPLLVSAFVTSGYLSTWPVLIALALFGANRALGNVRTALVCLAGHVIGSLVSEGIVAYRIDAGQLSAASRHLSDVGPSYVVLSAIVVALACGTWLARALAAVDLVLLVFPGRIFGGLSQLDVAAVGHLTATLTAAVATALIIARGRRRNSAGRGRRRPASDRRSAVQPAT